MTCVNAGTTPNSILSSFLLVPSVSPNISWYNLSSTSLQVEINAIPPPLRNGIVVGYRVYFWEQSVGQSSETNNSTTESVILLEGLEKYTVYCGQIVAYTRIGEGPRSPVECIRTFEDGKSFFFRMFARVSIVSERFLLIVKMPLISMLFNHNLVIGILCHILTSHNHFYFCIFLSYLAPEVPPTNLNTTNITSSSFYLTWDPIDPSQIPGILRQHRITYKVIDPGYNQFNGSYDGSFLVDSQATSVNVTGLIGFTNYEVMVNGVTVIDGPGNFTYLQTEEGSKKISKNTNVLSLS